MLQFFLNLRQMTNVFFRNTEVKNAKASETKLKKQIDHLKNQLKESETKIKNLEAAMGKKIDKLKSQLQEAETKVKSLKADSNKTAGKGQDLKEVTEIEKGRDRDRKRTTKKPKFKF